MKHKMPDTLSPLQMSFLPTDLTLILFLKKLPSSLRKKAMLRYQPPEKFFPAFNGIKTVVVYNFNFPDFSTKCQFSTHTLLQRKISSWNDHLKYSYILHFDDNSIDNNSLTSVVKLGRIIMSFWTPEHTQNKKMRLRCQYALLTPRRNLICSQVIDSNRPLGAKTSLLHPCMLWIHVFFSILN